MVEVIHTERKREEEKKPLILVVDDVPQNIQVVGTILREEGYEIAFSQSGRETLARVKSNHFDLILLDILMPGIDGYNVCEQLRKNPETEEIPVIFLTAKTDSESIVKGFEVGGQDYVTKPFNSAELLARVRTHLKLKKSRDMIWDINEQLKQQIRERRKAEEELKAHREHLKLIHKILRHDLINHLCVINSALRLHEKTKEEELLEEASARVDTCVELINRMKELESFISSHRGLKLYTVTDVLKTVMDCYHTVAFHIEGDGQVLADESLNSVIDNIINNAVVHGKTDKIDIDIGVKEEFCEIRIADYGTGIPDDIKDKIFEEGFIYGETGNTGLGLYIVKKTMEHYGGHVYVEDNKPVGAVLVLALRRVK